jgi:hypothetical protein
MVEDLGFLSAVPFRSFSHVTTHLSQFIHLVWVRSGEIVKDVEHLLAASLCVHSFCLLLVSPSSLRYFQERKQK